MLVPYVRCKLRRLRWIVPRSLRECNSLRSIGQLQVAEIAGSDLAKLVLYTGESNSLRTIAWCDDALHVGEHSMEQAMMHDTSD